MARALLGNLLYPSQTEGDGECECVRRGRECETDSCMGKAEGVDRVLQGKDLLRANFHSAKIWEKKQQMKISTLPKSYITMTLTK